ncbi:SET domain-containing protein [Sediminibacterium soli]|uniref:SET domain-containing protein n=1 Tax=Sediminibacterium soli TaxID=2698829 RepID=UPI00137ADF9E|nr:SET domain-containing protein-lysine N-methyltransferase [Sediminibacterium soli]NCI46324.1 SET domain-containing protein [Sediminibacterium soli]
MNTIEKKNLLVKRSKLPGAGNGLFTREFIPKGTHIVEYTGRVKPWSAFRDEHDNGYLFYVNRNHVIDAYPHKKALARYANDARGMVKQKGLTNNSEYVTVGRKVYIKSKRAIRPGEEILVGYGREYWAIRRENEKLEK